jgi:hypothetical protein
MMTPALPLAATIPAADIATLRCAFDNVPAVSSGETREMDFGE